jgi:hypothetical protein
MNPTLLHELIAQRSAELQARSNQPVVSTRIVRRKIRRLGGGRTWS